MNLNSRLQESEDKQDDLSRPKLEMPLLKVSTYI